MTKEGREGIRNIWMTGFGQAVRFILLLATAVTIPRLFGPEVYGQFSVVMAVISMLFVFSVMGLRFAELRILAPLFRDGDNSQAAGLASSIFNLRIFAGLVAASVCGFWLHLSNSVDDPVLLMAVVLFALTRYWMEAARSLLLPLKLIFWYIAIDLTNLILTLCALLLGYVTGGLSGAFYAASVIGALLLYTSIRLDKSVIVITVGKIEWNRIREVFPFCIFVLLSALFIASQASLPIWILSRFGTFEQAAYLGVSVQVLLTLRGLFTAFWQSLLPIMATMQERGEQQRLIQWVNLIMRVLAVLFSIAMFIWVFHGPAITKILLGSQYNQVFPCVTMMLLSAACFSIGACGIGIIELRKRADLGALNYLVFLLSTLAGIFWLYMNGMAGDAYHISQIYASSSIVFLLFSYLTLGLFEKIWIPVGRVLVLFAPLCLASISMPWYDQAEAGFIYTLVFLALYVSSLFIFRLIRWSEVVYAFSLVRSSKTI